MSFESVVTFVNELGQSDPELLEQLSESSPEQVLALARSRGVDATLDDVVAVGSAIEQALTSRGDDELNDEALDNVSGGLSIVVRPGVIVSPGGARLTIGVGGGKPKPPNTTMPVRPVLGGAGSLQPFPPFKGW